MNELINEQIELIQKELEEISNPYERAHVRVLFLNTLTKLTCEEEITLPQGKDSIRNDYVKPIEFEEKETGTAEEVEESSEDEVQEETVKELPREIDIDNDPSVTSNEPMLVDTEEGQIDIRPAYNLLSTFEGSEEEKVELASNITLYNLTAIYETLSQLTDCHNKMMLSYYMSEFGLEEMNGFVSQLTDDTFNDIYEFVNNDNLEGLIVNIENAIEE